MNRLIYFVLIITLLVACGSIDQQNIAVQSSENNEVRTMKQATQISNELLDRNSEDESTLLPEENSEKRKDPITHIVLHFSSNAANDPENPYNLEKMLNTFIDYGVSAHYLIGREGKVYKLVPENRVAYHAGKGNLSKYPNYKDRLNHYSIGIELMGIGTKDEMSAMIPESIYNQIPKKAIGFTESQYDSLNLLINDIITRYPSIKKDRDHIIGHDEYATNRKSDPGSLFEWQNLGF